MAGKRKHKKEKKRKKAKKKKGNVRQFPVRMEAGLIELADSIWKVDPTTPTRNAWVVGLIVEVLRREGLIAEPTRRVNAEVPKALYRAFKIRLATDGVKMREKIIEWIEDYTSS